MIRMPTIRLDLAFSAFFNRLVHILFVFKNGFKTKEIVCKRETFMVREILNRLRTANIFKVSLKDRKLAQRTRHLLR